MSHILLIISILLDGIITNYLPFLENNLSLFTPLLTIVSIFLVYPFYQKQEKKYYITIIIIGILYDLLYTNLLFFNAILFLEIAFVTRFIYKNYEITFIRLIIYLGIIIGLYEGTTGLILFIFQVVPITPQKVLYKISHSLLLNLIYGELLYFIIRFLPKKYKKISIN